MISSCSRPASIFEKSQDVADGAWARCALTVTRPQGNEFKTRGRTRIWASIWARSAVSRLMVARSSAVALALVAPFSCEPAIGEPGRHY
jgi:hypothetical protein